MDHAAERKARKQRKREEKLRHERMQKELKEHGSLAQTAAKERHMIGRYNIFLLLGLIMLVAVSFFAAMHWG